MNERFHCGDQEALVAYLYDDGDAAEREAVAAHVTRCASCAQEIAALRSTRSVLAAWSPPEASLGFRITDGVEDGPGVIGVAGHANAPSVIPFSPAPAMPARDADGDAGGSAVHDSPPPTAWWNRPLPAWAQVAAAALIFAAGAAVGSARTSVVVPEPGPAAPVTTAVAVQESPAISPQQIALIDDRLRALERMPRQMVPVPSQALTVDDRALVEQVESLVAESEERQRDFNVAMLRDVVRYFEQQRREDLRRVNDRLGQIHDSTGEELTQQRNALRVLMSQQVAVEPR